MHTLLMKPTKPHLTLEQAFWSEDLLGVVGLDEAGRGALAGPVTAAAVVLPPDPDRVMKKLEGVRDSKLLTPAKREYWAAAVRATALAASVGEAEAHEIDSIGIVPATRLAMERALAGLHREFEFLLIDYLLLPEIEADQVSLIKGDRQVMSIAAASILAKVARDEFMIELNEPFPSYAFANNKGYGTAQHLTALKQIGPCDYHRYSFRPVLKASQASPV